MSVHTSPPKFPRADCSPSPCCGDGTCGCCLCRVTCTQGPLLWQPLCPALLGGGWKSSDIISTEPDSSRLFSTSRAAQQGTHFISIKQMQASQLHRMIFFLLVAECA